MPWARNFFTAAGLLLLAGCSLFSWIPGVGGSDDDAEDALKAAPLTTYDAEVNISKSWGASIGKGLGRKYLRLQPVIVADRIYAADGYGHLEARDRFSGKRLWATQLEAEASGFFSGLNFIDRTDPSFVSGGVGAGAGMVFLGTTNGELIAFSAADGTQLWRGIVGSEVLAPAVTGDGLVFVQAIDGSLVALEGDSGAVRWRFDSQVPVLTLRGTATPVFDNDVVYAGFGNGTLSAVRAENGEPLWEHRVKLPEGRSELDRMVDVDSTPLVRGPSVFAVAYQGNLHALRRGDGNMIWEMKMSSFLDTADGYGQIYVVDENDVVTAVDQGTAEVVWRQEALWRRRLSSPTAFSNYIAVADDDGYLHILAQSDGRLLGRRKLDGKGVRSRMIYVDGVLYAMGNSGSLMALEISTR
jgi:outer membrane protein assembly factor BamB